MRGETQRERERERKASRPVASFQKARFVNVTGELNGKREREGGRRLITLLMPLPMSREYQEERRDKS